MEKEKKKAGKKEQETREDTMSGRAKKKSKGIWVGAVKNTSDIPAEKIPLHARETVPMIKTRKSEESTFAG